MPTKRHTYASEVNLTKMPPSVTGVSRDGEVEVAIKNEAGKIVADNQYTLLVGDQAAAKAKSLRFLEEAMERLEKHGHSVYRYWPEMWEETE